MPDTKTIQLDALDTLFFKDGKPFSMGEDTWADGIFPPPPSVLYGALRTQYLSANSSLDINNIQQETESLEITQIYYKLLDKKEETSHNRLSASNFLPLPADLVERDPKIEQRENTDSDFLKLLASLKRKEEKSKNYETRRLPVKKLDEKVVTSSENLSAFPFWTEPNSIVEQVKNGFIDANDLWQYLANPDMLKFKAKKLDDYLRVEPKTGIKRNRHTRTTSDDGDLYRVGMRRASGFQIEVSFKELPDYKFFSSENQYATLKLGAEGKIAHVRPREYNLLTPPKGLSGQLFRMYLATPVIILTDAQENRIYPKVDFFDESVSCIGAAIYKPYFLGGFDMKERRPKPMYKVVPAGSVFYYRSANEINFDKIQGMKVSEVGSKEGFGIAYFGKLNLEE